MEDGVSASDALEQAQLAHVAAVEREHHAQSEAWAAVHARQQEELRAKEALLEEREDDIEELRLELGSARKIHDLELQKKELRINELEARVQELLTQLATLSAAARAATKCPEAAQSPSSSSSPPPSSPPPSSSAPPPPPRDGGAPKPLTRRLSLEEGLMPRTLGLLEAELGFLHANERPRRHAFNCIQPSSAVSTLLVALRGHAVL